MSIRKLMTKVNLESEAEETVGATEEDILDVIENDEITAELVEASKEANEAAEADQELTDLAEEVTETIGDIEEKLEDTVEVEPEDVAVAQESLRHYKKMLGIKDEGTKISLESMRTDTKANLENIKVELEGVLDTIKDSAKKVWDWIIGIFNKIKELFKAGYAKIVGFFKSIKWKNKPEQIKTANAINVEVAKTTGVEAPYINATVYKEAVVDQLHSLEKEINDMGKETSNSIGKSFKEVNKRIDNLKSGEVVKKEQAVLLLTYTKKEDLDKATEKAMKSSYALFALMNPVKVANGIIGVSLLATEQYNNMLSAVNKLLDGDEKILAELKEAMNSTGGSISANTPYSYVVNKCKELIKIVSREDIPVTAIPVPRVGNTIAVYDTVPNAPTTTYTYEVSDIISERGRQVADKYGAEEVFKAFDMLDSKSSSVMKDIDKVLTGTTALRNRVGESKTLDAGVAKFLRELMRMSQDMLKFNLDYQKYLVTTVNLINNNTVNK